MKKGAGQMKRALTCTVLAAAVAASMAPMDVLAADGQQSPVITVGAGQGQDMTVTLDQEDVPLAGTLVREPVASGTVTYGNGKATIDASNISQGYVMIKYTGGQQRIKVQITKGATTYTYDLNARDAYEVFPFTEGSGSYIVKVFENVSGNQYAQICSQTLSVSLADEFLPFLYPNQYVNFSAGSAAVRTGAQIAAGAGDDIGVVTAVYDYVVNNLTYDYAKAQSVQSGYLPNIDTILSTKTGICFDYAALMAAMLRSQNIPTKMVFGYTGNLYHAWVSVYISNVGWVDDVIYFDGQKWSLMDPTFRSTGGNNEATKKHVGNSANYQAKYAY